MRVDIHNEVTNIGDPAGEEDRQIIFPENLQAWAESLKKSILDYGYIQMAISCPASDAARIVFLSQDTMGQDLKTRWNGFGFVVDLKTLKQMKGALEAAIVAVETRK